MNTTSLTKTQHELVAVTAERDHWKANHDNRVKAAKILTDRTDMPLERVGAYKHYVAALEANQKLRDALIAAETKLETLFEQEPVAYVKYKQTGGNVGISWVAIPTGAYPNEGDPLYAAPIPALAVPAVPAVPAAITDELAYQVLTMALRNGTREAFPDKLRKLFAVPAVSVCHMECDECAKAGKCLYSMQANKSPIPAPPTPFIPDDDTRRNDEAFAAQQAATAPSVPDVLIQLRDKVTRIPHRTEYLSGQQFAYVRLCEVVGEIEDLLQSSDHSSEVKK